MSTRLLPSFRSRLKQIGFLLALFLVFSGLGLPLEAIAMSTLEDIQSGSLDGMSQSLIAARHEIAPSHWSYRLVQSLSEKTGINQGEDAITLDGQRPVTRTEMAILISDLSGALRKQGVHSDITEGERAKLEVLQEEFQSELKVLKARIERVETSVETLSSDVQKLEENDAKTIHLGRKGTAQLYGQFHAWHTAAFDDNQTQRNTSLRRANIGVKGQLSDVWQYNVMFDPVRSQNPMKDFWLEYTGIPHHAVRIGQFRAVTYDASARSSSRNYTNERSMIGVLANVRELGVAAYGKWKYMDYMLGAFNGNGDNRSEDNNRQGLAGRMVVRPLAGLMDEERWGLLELGSSFYNGNSGQPGAIRDRDRRGLEARYHHRRFEINTEYLSFDEPTLLSGDGYYVETVYKVNPKLNLVARYDTIDMDKATPDNHRTEYLAGFNYLWEEYNVRLGVYYAYLVDKAGLNNGSALRLLVQHTF